MTLLMLALSVAFADPVAQSPAPAGGWHELYAESAEASSFLKSNWNKYTENYHPSYALDDNPATAWVEGADGDGIGETLTIPVSPLKSARTVRLQIRNGYQKSQMLLDANAVPKDVKIKVLSGGDVVASKEVVLTKAMGWQEISIPVPAGASLDGVSLTIGSVYAGKSYKDTCISDIKVSVDSDVPYNAAFEQGKQAELKKWIAERVATAQYFASQPKEFAFATATFQSDTEEVAPDANALDAELAPLRTALAAAKADPKWYRAEMSGKAPVWPDGLWGMDAFQRAMQPALLSFFETPDQKGRHEKTGNADEGWSSEQWWSNYKVQFASGPGSAAKSAYLTFKEVSEGRGTYIEEQEIFVEYDASQRPTRVYVSKKSNDAEMGGSEMLPTELIYTFGYDAAGKIGTVTARSRGTQFTWSEASNDMVKELVTWKSVYKAV